MLNLKDIPQPIIDFIELHKEKQISKEEFLNTHTNKLGIHNHTVENLFLYFDLDKHLSKGRVVFYPGVCFIVDNRKHKFFVFEAVTDFFNEYDFSAIPEELHKKLIFYTAVEQNSNPLFIKSKLKEGEYFLNDIFDEKTYYKKYEGRSVKDIKKKIYNRIVYPFKYLAKPEFRVEDITEEHFDIIEKMHKEWCDFKLADPKTFVMMFSSNRYQRCIKMMYQSEHLKREDFFAKIFYWNNEPIAVRQCVVKGDNSYDIGFFSLFFKAPSNLINYINTYCLASLNADYGVKRHDTGMLLNKSLEVNKSHFPNSATICYKYNFTK